MRVCVAAATRSGMYHMPTAAPRSMQAHAE
ncbi:MAG: hypothetical protein RLZZ362_1975, partial [Actinomycetota bacterium]